MGLRTAAKGYQTSGHLEVAHSKPNPPSCKLGFKSKGRNPTESSFLSLGQSREKLRTL